MDCRVVALLAMTGWFFYKLSAALNLYVIILMNIRISLLGGIASLLTLHYLALRCPSRASHKAVMSATIGSLFPAVAALISPCH